MFAELITNWGAIAGAITTICVLLFGIWKWIISPIVSNLASKWGEFLAKVDSVPELLKQVNTLTAEICVDDGTEHSISDRISTLQNTQSVTQQIQDFILLDGGIATFMSDHTGEFVSVNREFASMMRRSPDELKGNGWYSLLGQDSTVRQPIVSAWTDAWTKEYDIVLPIIRFILHDGSIVPVRFIAYKLTDPKGKFIGHIGFIKKLELKRKTDEGKEDLLKSTTRRAKRGE